MSACKNLVSGGAAYPGQWPYNLPDLWSRSQESTVEKCNDYRQNEVYHSYLLPLSSIGTSWGYCMERYGCIAITTNRTSNG